MTDQPDLRGQGGELAQQRFVAESMEYNATRRSLNYRLLSNPDMVVALGNPSEASLFAGNLMAKQDNVATDLGVIMPYVFGQIEQPPYDHGE